MRTAVKNVIMKAKRRIKDSSGEVLPEFAVIFITIMRRYKRQFGVYPNLFHPKTINDKVLHRMLFDRRPILAQLEDKYTAREYVRQKVGEHILPKWYFVTKNPATIPFDDLPGRFVVKPTHGSGWVYMVPAKPLLNRQDLLSTCHCWLSQNYYRITREWPYKYIEPRIVIEEFIDDGTGPIPMDYRLFVFNGRVEVIRVDVRRAEDRRWNHYDRFWNRVDVPCRFKNIDGEVGRPSRLDDMLRYAEALGKDLDFVRIDMYHAQDKVYFGETTTLPMGGMMAAYPHEFNLHLGKLWKPSLE